MFIKYKEEQENTYYNLVLYKKDNQYRIYTLKIETSKKLYGKGTAASEEILISVKPGMIPLDGWVDSGDDSTTGGGDYEYQCRVMGVEVDVFCTGAGTHTQNDLNCDCEKTIFTCKRGYTQYKIKEICEYVWVGEGDAPNNSGNTGTGNTGNGGGTGTSDTGNPIDVKAVNPNDVIPEGVLQTIIDCVTPNQSQTDWLNNELANNSTNIVSIWNYINENGCEEAKKVISESIEENIVSGEEFEEIFKRKKGCQKLKKLVNDNPNTNIKTHLQNLQPMISETGEYGSEFTLDTSNNYNASSVPPSSGNSLPFNLRPELYALAHTHPLSGFSMFSFKDVFLLYGIYRKARSDLKNKALVFMVSKETATSVPQTYVITINNFNTFYSKLTTELNNIQNSDGNSNKTLTVKEKVDKLVEKYKEKEYNSTNRELTFLNFFSTYGISMYKANDTNISGWSQLVSNSNSTSVTTKPCN